MMIKSKTNVVTSLSCLFAAAMLSGCVIHVNANNEGGEVTGFFGDTEVSAGKTVTNVSNVNGSIILHDGVTARHVSGVNGTITLGEKVTVASIDNVNGSITAKQAFTSLGNISNVNGDIIFSSNSSVEGDINSVNGNIKLEDTKIGNITTQNSNIDISGKSEISGDIVFKKREGKWNWGNKKQPKLTLTEQVIVGGDIVLYRPVILELATEQQQNKVVIRYALK